MLIISFHRSSFIRWCWNNTFPPIISMFSPVLSRTSLHLIPVHFCQRQYMVRFNPDQGIDHMKVNWHHSKFKQIWTTEHDSNPVPSVQISFSHCRFVSYRISLHMSSCFMEKICKIQPIGKLCDLYMLRTTQCIWIRPSNYSTVCLTMLRLSGIMTYQNRIRTFWTLISVPF